MNRESMTPAEKEAADLKGPKHPKVRKGGRRVTVRKYIGSSKTEGFVVEITAGDVSRTRENRPSPFNLPDSRWHHTRRDSHQSKVYASEVPVSRFDQERFDDIKQVAQYLKRLMQTEWFRRRWPNFRHCTVYYKPKIKGAWASCRGDYCPLKDTRSGYIRMGNWALGKDLDRAKPGGEWLVLHELAHVLCHSGVHHHALWAATFLELVKFRLGHAAYVALRDSFKAGGVKYKPIKQLSEAQREAMRERMKKARAALTKAA